MQKSKVIGIFVTGLAISAAIIYYLSPRMGGRHGRVSQNAGTSQGLDESSRIKMDLDLKTLDKKDAQPVEFFGALIRLSQRKVPEALVEALNRVKDQTPLIRAGVANSLGYFEDSGVLTPLSELLKDPEQNVRIQAINGLGHRATKERQSSLESLLLKKDLPIQERVAAHSSLLTASIDPKRKADSISELIKIAKDPLTPFDQGTVAVMRVLGQSPKEDGTIQMLKGLIEKSTNPFVIPVAIRHLANLHDPSIPKTLKRFADHKSPQVRMAVLQAAKMSCQPDRYAYLEHAFKTDKESQVIATAIRMLKELPTNESKKVIESAIKKSLIKDDNLKAAQGLLAELNREVRQDPCLKK